MESCLKKLVLDAPETGFQDAERAERKPLVPPGRELVPGGIHWRQMGVDSLPSGVQKVYSSKHELFDLLQKTDARRKEIFSIDNYARAMAFISHEIGHRWLAFLDFIDDSGVSRPLHDVFGHWLGNVPIQSAVTFKETYEASPMQGGPFWVENNDGTFTDYIQSSPSGYGFLDLYAMGLMRPEEVPDFFLLENISESNAVNPRRTVRAEKKVISIQSTSAIQTERIVHL